MTEFEANLTSLIFSIGKDSFNFQRLLDKFNDAKNITIVTLDINSYLNRYNKLLKNLHQLQGKNITIISNIPKRLSDTKRKSYNRKHYDEDKEHKEIIRYFSALDPTRFNSPTRVYFNFDNHAKIIIADEHIYIGSANFTEFSRNNFEGGVIIHDKNIAIQIEKSLCDEIISDDSTIRYAGNEKEPLSTIADNLSKLLDKFYGAIYVEDVNGNQICKFFSNQFCTELDDLKDVIIQFETFISESDDTLIDKYDLNTPFSEVSKAFTNLRNIINSSAYNDFSTFNDDEYAYNYFSKNYPMYSEPEELDILDNYSHDQATLHRQDLLNKYWHDLQNSIISLQKTIDHIILKVANIAEMEAAIDDTCSASNTDLL